MTATTMMRRNFSLLLLMAITLLAGSTAFAATVSGSVQNLSSSTGRIFIGLINSYGDTPYGVSVVPSPPSASTQFSLHGVDNGTYSLGVFLDRTATGAFHANDPANLVNNVSVNGGNDVNIPTTVQLINMPPVLPTSAFNVAGNVNILPGTGGAAIIIKHEFDKATGGIVADSYAVNCTSSTLGTIIRTATVSGVDNSNAIVAIGGLAAGSTLSCTVTPVVNATPYPSFAATTDPATTGDTCNVFGTCSSGATVTGQVDLSAFSPAELSGKTLVVALSDWSDNPPYIWAVNSPASVQSYTIPGVAPNNRAYRTETFLVDSTNGNLGAGMYQLNEKTEHARLTIENNQPVTAPLLKLLKRNSYFSVNTRTQYSQFNSTPTYSLIFKYRPCAKRAVNIVITNGTGTALPVSGISYGAADQLSIYSATKPHQGDTYTAAMTYADNSTENLTLTVIKGVSDDFVMQSFPVGNVRIPDLSNPVMSWYYSLPQNMLPYTVRSSTGNSSNTDNFTSATNWRVSALSSPLGLEVGSWVTTELEDIMGDSIEYDGGYTPKGSGPLITSFSQPGGVTGDDISIYGSGFTGASKVTFNGIPATAYEVVSSGEISATVPNLAARGPITVTDASGITGSSSVPFSKTAIISGQLIQGTTTSTGVNGISIQAIGSGIPPVTTSSVTGTLAGEYSLSLPAGIPVQLKIHDPSSTYRDVYSKFFSVFGDPETGHNFNLFTTTDIAGWEAKDASFTAVKNNVTGMIAGRIKDSSGNNLASATIAVLSKNYPNGNAAYKVIYVDSSNNPDTARTNTGSNGRFLVTGVEQGDIVYVAPSYPLDTTYAFFPAYYQVFNGAISQGKIIGAPMPTATLSPASGTVNSGSSVTVTLNTTPYNGTNNTGTFYYTTDNSDPRYYGKALTSGQSFVLNVPGGVPVRYVVKNAANVFSNTINSTSYNVIVDNQKPTINSIQYNGYNSTNHYNTNSVSYSIFATDNSGPPLWYLITPSNITPSPSDPGWSQNNIQTENSLSEATYTRYAWAKDAVGNISLPTTVTFTVDLTPPTTLASPSVLPTSGYYIPGVPINVTLTANEPGMVYYTTNGSNPNPAACSGPCASGPSPRFIPVNDTTTCKFLSVDLAGNMESFVTSATYNFGRIISSADGINAYNLVGAALDSISADNTTISVKADTYIEDITMTKPYSTKLLGGYTDNSFIPGTANGTTIINGKFTIRFGSLTVDRIAVR